MHGTSLSHGSAHLESKQNNCAHPLQRVLGEMQSKLTCCAVQQRRDLYFSFAQHQDLQQLHSTSRQQQADLIYVEQQAGKERKQLEISQQHALVRKREGNDGTAG